MQISGLASLATLVASPEQDIDICQSRAATPRARGPAKGGTGGMNILHPLHLEMSVSNHCTYTSTAGTEILPW